MCGIAGIHAFGAERFDAALVEPMTQSLVHRGPDDCGYAAFAPGRPAHDWRRGGDAPAEPAATAFGSRRLSIVDLSDAGHQPMAGAGGRLWISYNGEVYNHLELRRELEGLGHEFRSGCDVEVVLAAFEHWGTACFHRFNGMWALAIYDGRSDELVLSRDRFGVKPLYVHRGPGRLVWGSEAKALFACPGVPRSPDLGTIYDYVARHYRWVDGGRQTFFEGVEYVPAGHVWVVDRAGGVREEPFWRIDPDGFENGISDGDARERFRELFSDAVRLRLRADVPVATLLSGGLDSSSVTAMAAAHSAKPVTAFSARFDEPGYDEGEWIDALVAHVGADARSIHPRSPDLIPTLQTMLRYHDEPVCTATWFAHWLIMEDVAGEGFPVILNGHVGDELFAGYWDHYMYNLADLEHAHPARFETELAAWQDNHGRDPGEWQRVRAAILAGELRTADARRENEAVAGERLLAARRTPERPDPFAGRDNLTGRLWQELRYETVPATLRPEDRDSMAFSIESRSPFLDYRLVEFAFALPSRFKIRGGLGKWLVREAMGELLPATVRERRNKQGLIAPTEHWFRGASRDAVRDVLASPELAARGLLRQDEVLRRFDEHVAGQANHYLEIWQWLNLELWMREFFH